MGYTKKSELSVAKEILEFAGQALAANKIDESSFWEGVSQIVHDLSPKNRQLLQERETLQTKIDEWHKNNPGQPEPQKYREFLTEIGYLEEQPEPVSATTQNVDPEIATTAGPQLVVPITNARFALNAVNARWGSLYDALYGTDAISQQADLAPGNQYNPTRGAKVIERGRELLDQAAPLKNASHTDATGYEVRNGALVVKLATGETELQDSAAFVGYKGSETDPQSIVFKHNGLHIDVIFDENGNIGATDDAKIQDIVLESAVTTIMDLEDSVATVDAEDKALGYSNWRGLLDGTLTEEIHKNGKTFTRKINPDRTYLNPAGEEISLPGRSTLFVRNVGHLMTTAAVLDKDGQEVPEGILDAIMTVLGSLPDLQDKRNSRTGSIYIVKPKMHGSKEVLFAKELFERVEELYGLEKNTIKMGIMDEERRTSVNLNACIAAASERVVFINTGFLDRTGDEIHTSKWAGPMLPKAKIGQKPWLASYEARNVTIGIAAGLSGKAQIGKGMWAKPDLMHDMLEQKIAHVQSGASTAWVPSPTAATLHSLHYHEVDAFEVRENLPAYDPASINDLLQLPLAGEGDLDEATVVEELDNNVQSILGYVVRWIDQGVGCSKVPDIHDVALMEDRATLRISSQLLANWLMHGVITEEQVDESLSRLSKVVDDQNQSDPKYVSLLKFDGTLEDLAYTASRKLILEGAQQPNGYTEPILHEYRRMKKTGLYL